MSGSEEVTPKVRARELAESEARFREVVDNIPQLAWMADHKGGVDWFNRGWLEYTGTTLEENQGLGWKAVHHPDHVEAVAAKFMHHLALGLDWEDTFPLRGKDGKYRWFLSRMKAIRDESGEVVRFFGTNTDVTAQLAAEDALRESDRRKNEFLAMLAHELRNPLAPIQNFLQLLQSPSSSPETVKHASEVMGRQVKQMVRLVDDLLDVSRISLGKIELRRARIDLTSAAVNHAVETIRPLCKSLGHELTVKVSKDAMFLDGDAIRLAQVIGNLLTNACKFTKKGGKIELSVERDSGEAVIRVKDTGIGIAKDQLSRIFDLFVQVDTSLERSSSGLGIGLTLVKNLVEMHGGSVQVHSDGLGHGTEFVIRLPLVEDTGQASEPEAAPTNSSPPGPPRRVLVVDDNYDAASSLAMLLDLAGNQTEMAHDGLEALKTAETFRPDVVLLDIGLPKLDGYEVCRRLRAEPWGKGMTLVALTGWGQADDRRKSREAGFNGHLLKPVDFDALTKLLAEFPVAAPDLASNCPD